MKTLLLILAASLLVTALFRAVLRLVRANREEQRDTEPNEKRGICNHCLNEFDWRSLESHLGLWACRPCLALSVERQIKRNDTLPSPPMFSTTIRDGRDMPIELGKNVIPITSAEQWRELTGDSCPGFERAFRELVEGEEPPPKLNPDLPPMDFGELPDVTGDAVESAAKVLSEPPPKGEVA